MKNPPHNRTYGPAINRIADLMIHTNRYAFQGVGRLAEDTHVNASSVSRLINNKINPSFIFVARITNALEKELGIKIDPRDLVAENGLFPTRFACDLAACSGCLPEAAIFEPGLPNPLFAGVKKGQWVTSRFPNGFDLPKGGA